MYDAYIRVSQTGDRDEEESTEVYEAQCRSWADRSGVEIDEVVEDTDVSGSVAVSERGLERLVQKVEADDSEGIVTPHLDRFGRDLIEGALALKRIVDAGGRLVAVLDGFDSASPGSELNFNIRMAIAQDYLQRVRSNFQASVDRAVERGVYVAKTPFGYRRDEERRLVADEDEAGLVVELFERRAEGQNYAELTRWLQSKLDGLPPRPDPETGEDRRRRTISKQGVRTVMASRAYLGEARVSSGRNGSPRIIKKNHPPLVTDAQWEAAQIKPAFVPRNGTASGALLRGLVFCATCGKRCKTGLSGPQDRRRVSYVCTSDGCSAHASMSAPTLDDHVEDLLMRAAAAHEPHVEAVILGDTRYQDAMEAVEEARVAHQEFRDSVELQRELGVRDFAAGLRVRKEALEVARRDLSKVRPPSPSRNGRHKEAGSVEEVLAERDRERIAGLVDRVVLKPAGIERRGNPPPPEERADVYLAGADEPWQPTYAKVPRSVRERIERDIKRSHRLLADLRQESR